LARAALEAHRFEEARAALVPLLGDPTQRACLLMAEIEATEHGDHGKAREWALRAMRAKRDPAWVADGYVTEEWMPASPQTGRLDAFVWSALPRSRRARFSNRSRSKPWRWCRYRSERCTGRSGKKLQS
jgi:HemY protein